MRVKTSGPEGPPGGQGTLPVPWESGGGAYGDPDGWLSPTSRNTVLEHHVLVSIHESKPH